MSKKQLSIEKLDNLEVGLMTVKSNIQLNPGNRTPDELDQDVENINLNIDVIKKLKKFLEI